jgi:hypothetical protein
MHHAKLAKARKEGDRSLWFEELHLPLVRLVDGRILKVLSVFA